MQSKNGRFLAIIAVGYLGGLTVQQWIETGATSELLGPTLLVALATLAALYTAVAS
jgi:hypothetical protein